MRPFFTKRGLAPCLLLLAAVFFYGASVAAEDTTYDPFAQNDAPQQERKFPSSFMAPSLVQMPTTKPLPENSLDFLINHRFGSAKTGFDDFFGFDRGANIQFALDYGITDKWSVGIARTSYQKTYELRTKYALLQQSYSGMPISLSFYGVVGQETADRIVDLGPYLTSPPITGDTLTDQKLADLNRHRVELSPQQKTSYLASLLISHRINDMFTLQIAPMYIHRNFALSHLKNDRTGVEVGGRVKLSKRVHLIFESIFATKRDYVGENYDTANSYSAQYDSGFGPVFLKKYTVSELSAGSATVTDAYLRNVAYAQPVRYNYVPASIGVDIDTGGHVFQLFVSNDRTLSQVHLLRGADFDYGKKDYVVGFNIHRNFWFGDQDKRIREEQDDKR